MTSGVLFDAYERRARLAPGLILILPVAITIAALGLRHNTIIAALVSLLSLAGGPLILAAHVRQRGVTLQARLYEKWGGPPSTIKLRLTSADPPGPVQAKFRKDTQRVSGQTLPKWAEQQADAARADETYSVALAALRSKTGADRKKFFLVFAEVKNYGFERNLFAVRFEALVLCLLCLVGLGAALGVAIHDHSHVHRTDLIIGLAIVAATTLFWLFWPSERRVRRTGDIYAERLLEAAADL